MDKYRKVSNVWEDLGYGKWKLKYAVWDEKDNDELLSRVKRPDDGSLGTRFLK